MSISTSIAKFKIHLTDKNSSLRFLFYSGLILVIVNLTVSLVNFFYEINIARLLGPEKYSTLAAFISAISILSLPATIITINVIQQLGKMGDQQAKNYVFALENWLWKTIKAKLALIIITIFITSWIVTNWVGLSRDFFWLIGIGLCFTLISSFYNGLLQGLGWLGIFGIFSCISVVIKYMGIPLIWFGFEGLQTAAIFILLASFPFGLFYFLIKTRKIKHAKNSFKLEYNCVDLLRSRQFLIIVTSSLSLNLMFFLSNLLAKKYLSDYEAGIYSAWFKLSCIPMFLISPVISAFYLSFAKKQQLPRDLHAITLTMFFIYGIITYFSYSSFNFEIVSYLYGNKYNALFLYMPYAAINSFFIVLINYCHQYLLTRLNWAIAIIPIISLIHVVLVALYGKSTTIVIVIELIIMGTSALLYFLFYMFQVRKEYWPSEKPLLQ